LISSRNNNGRNSLNRLYPLTAVVGQEPMKTALLLLAVDPGLGGVLLIGEKGTAKSTAARALAELLPAIPVVQGCPFHCDPKKTKELCPHCLELYSANGNPPSGLSPAPFLTLPLGLTEDRLMGGLDLELAVETGLAELQPGLLGQANRGILYVDEINLLEPYLGHLLLDAVEFGRVLVEREGLSVRHTARVALIGSMNPEEGPLGPQLLDRFALAVRVKGETDPAARAEIIRRRLVYEADPSAFRRSWMEETKTWCRRIVAARRRLTDTILTPAARRLLADLVRQTGALGHRGDLALARAARAKAAWEGLAEAGPDQVAALAGLALDFRRVPRKNGRPAGSPAQKISPPAARHFETPYITSSPPQLFQAVSAGDGGRRAEVFRVYEPNEAFDLLTPTSRREQGPRQRSGRRSTRQAQSKRGRYFRSSPERLGRPVALDATLRAAAPYQIARRGPDSPALVIRQPDLREKVFRQKTGRLILFVVDASGSVGGFDRMAEAKAAALALLSEAYQKRDRVGLIAFHGSGAQVLLPPTDSVELARGLLEDLPTGGKTPLAEALVKTHQLVRVELARDPGLTPLIVLMTDGRPNVPLTPGTDPWRETLNLASHLRQDPRLRFLLLDTDSGHYSDYTLMGCLAERLEAPRLTLEDLRHGRMEAWLERLEQ